VTLLQIVLANACGAAVAVLLAFRVRAAALSRLLSAALRKKPDPPA
jgi:hypothetical protein